MSNGEPPRAVESRIAGELEQVTGVLAAAVWLGENGQAREVYIAAGPDASVSGIQRAAREILRRNGLAATEEHIRIGRIDGTVSTPRAQEVSGPAGRFLLLEGVKLERTDSHIRCRVSLLRKGERFEGEARELNTEAGRARAAARATLAAADKTGPASLGLDAVMLTELFGRRYVVVSVEASAARRLVFLSGMLAIDATRSVEESATLATFRAVERFIAW